MLGLLPEHALLVVLELGLHPAKRVEVLVALGGDGHEGRVLGDRLAAVHLLIGLSHLARLSGLSALSAVRP